MTKKVGWFGAVLGVLGVCGAAEVTFTGNGSYLDAAAWPDGVLPTAADAVTVAPGATLTYAGGGGQQALASLTLGTADSGLTTAAFAATDGTLRVDDGVVLAAAGLLQLGAGGRIDARRVSREGSGFVTCDGGTFGVSATGATLTSYFDHVGRIELGTGGLTFDTGDNAVWAWDIPVVATSSMATSTVAKAGTGSLGLVRLPNVDHFAINAGTVLVGGARPSVKTNLRHRWSFNDTLEDSVGGCNAELYKPAGPMTDLSSTAPTRSTVDVKWTSDSRAVVLAGGAQAEMLGLGDNILPRTGPVTIELWATLSKRTAKARAFAFGSTQSDGLVFTFATDETETGASALSLLGTDVEDQTGPGLLAEGTEYYIVCVIVPADDGGSVVTVYTRNAKTGARVGTTSVKAAWSVGELEQSGAWLGWAWTDDAVAAASFDELRVWNAALTEADVDSNVLLGPDVLPDEGTTVTDNVFPDNPSYQLRLQNYLVHRWSFNGSWEDTIGGKTAKPMGSVSLTADGRQAKADSASSGSQNYIDLGSNILPTKGPVTIELWSTLYSRQHWEKAFVIGSGEKDCMLFTYTSKTDDGQSSFYLISTGASIRDVEGTGMYDLGVEHCLCITLIPRAGGGTDAVVRVWNTETQELVGTVTYSSTWTVDKMVQTYARLNDSLFWSDPEANASYNELRIWNAGLSEAQQRVDIKLGPDSLPTLEASASAEVTPSVSLAAGTTLDLLGATLETAGVAGSGTVQNGVLEVHGVLAPGGDGKVGTLTLDADVKVVGTIRLDVGDKIVCAGEADLTQAVIEIADKTQLKGTYVFLTSSADGVKGPVKGDNLKGTGKALCVKPDCAYVQSAPLALFFR